MFVIRSKHMAIKENPINYGPKYPQAFQTILRSFCVDDGLGVLRLLKKPYSWG